jgi:hypothetical protein
MADRIKSKVDNSLGKVKGIIKHVTGADLVEFPFTEESHDFNKISITPDQKEQIKNSNGREIPLSFGNGKVLPKAGFSAQSSLHQSIYPL